MSHDTDTGRVHVLDIRGVGGGTLGSRGVEADWADDARVTFDRARRRGRGVLRLEWIGVTPRDPLDGDEAAPAPAEWVDVISATEGGAMIRVRLRRGATPGDQPVRTAFEIRDDGGEVTTRYVRRLGHGSLLSSIDGLLGDFFVGRVLGPVWGREVHRPGRRGREPVFYAEWARRYVEALKVAARAPILRLVAEEEADGRPGVTAAQIRAYLNRARDRGLLTSSPAGQPGGKLTPTAHKLLGSTIPRKGN